MKSHQTAILSLALLTVHGRDIHAANIENESRPRPESIDGNSVDTATGAFLEDVTLVTLKGARAMDLTLSYNSRLTKVPGYVGYGWSHQYEARITGDPAGTVTVYFNRNIGNEFRFVAAGQPYTPLNGQNRYDVLERVSISGVNDIWRLRRMNGTTYFFDPTTTPDPLLSGFPTFRLAKIEDKNGHAIIVNHGANGVSETKVGNLAIGFSYRPGAGISPYRPPFLHYVTNGAYHTFLQYNAKYLLTRIYDPVELQTVGENTASAPIPLGATGVSYPISVATATATDRLFRVSGSIQHPKPETLRAFLSSPSGTKTVQINTDGKMLFMDDFLGVNPNGTWTLNVIDNVNDGSDGTIASFKIERSVQAPNWTAYEYDAFPFNHLTKATDSKGKRLYSNTYNEDLIAFQDDGRDDNGGWEFTYGFPAGGDRITIVKDRTPAKNATRYLHDSDFRLKTIEDALGNKTEYTYHAVTGDRTSLNDARGKVTSFGYDAKGNLTSTVTPDGKSTTFGYDVRGNLTKVTDALGLMSTFQYDAANNLTSVTNPNGAVQQQIFDGTGMLTGSINKSGVDAVFYSYDANGALTSANAGGEPETKVEYDSVGRVIKITDASGNENTMVYDNRGNLTQKRNALGHTNSSQFDHRNRRVSETDARGGVSTYEYDGNDNVTRIINPLNQSTFFAYDGENHLIRVTDPAGNSTWTEYDAIGQVVKERNEYGSVATYSYDAVGNRTDIFGPTGVRESQTTYNELNKTVNVENAHGHTVSFGYDALGQRTTETNPRGKTTTLERDAMGRVAKVIDPLGRQYRSVYKTTDVLDKIVDAAGGETRFTYTQTNQVKTITTPGGLVTTLDYTPDGNIKKYTPPNGLKALDYTYDAAGRRERKKPLIGGPPDTVYDYDGNGNLTTVSTQATVSGPKVAKIARAYDALNREISQTDADGQRVQRVYNAAGLVSQIIYPDNKIVQYAYDPAKRLRTITDWAGRVTAFEYNSNNDITRVQFPNQTTRVMKYDETGRLLSRADFDASGATIVSYQYSYDATGFIAAERLDAAPAVYEPPLGTFEYGIDSRLTKKDGSTLSYDAGGNVALGPIGGQSVSLQWDYYDNLASAGQTVFSYNAEDRLIGWQSGGETVKFRLVEAGGGSQILVNESSTLNITRYVYGVGLAYEETNGQIKVHHYDERGNTVALTNSTGQVTGRIAYSPFGETIASSGDTESVFKFGGLYGLVTAPNGLINMRFRWYSPEMKRFLSMDSRLGVVTSPISLNRYIYAGCNPINFNDPHGEFGFLVGAAIGFVAGVVGEVASSLIDGKIPDWRDVVAAGVGGAITGGLATLGPLGSIVGGTLGASVEYLVKTGLRSAVKYEGDDPALAGFNIESFGISAVIGFAGGALGGGITGAKSLLAKRALGKSLAKRAAAGVARRGAISHVSKSVGAKAIEKSLSRAANKEIAAKFIVDFAFELGPRSAKRNKDSLLRLVGYNNGPSGNDDTKTQDLGLPTLLIGKGGEYTHLNRFKEALESACRPFPDTTNRLSPF